MMSVIELILATCREVKAKRDLNGVMHKVTEEVGELATEVAIQTGASYKEPGVDGIAGEAIDAIIALTDLIYVEQPGITEEELAAIAHAKLNKWKKKAGS